MKTESASSPNLYNMYGSDQTDFVVKYYDLAFGINGEAECAWYLHKVQSSGGPVLDLACGTGRLALLLAEEGFEVAGIDQSNGMLNQFREKLLDQPEEHRQRVHIENQKMTGFDLGRSFNSIICCDAFFHNLTVQAEMDCLQRVAKHLNPNGRFVFNLPNPTCEYILQSAASEGRIFKERGRYVLENGLGLLVVEQAEAIQLLDQRITTTLRMRRYDPAGNEVEKGESTWSTRYLFPYEAVHLLYRCGFEVVSLVGDYRNGPVTERGQLIFEVKKSK
jgi:2-polyprenyl-3-methyl-5-hydroxy-6-metoxy-1,4-benzoquinol methylase